MTQYDYARRTLVTGGAGFLGSRIVRSEVEDQALVTVVDNMSTGALENVDHTSPHVQAMLGFGAEGMMFLQSHDRVFHMASPASPDVFRAGWQSVVESNIVGALRAVRATVQGGLLIVASSSEAYGQPTTRMSEDCLGLVRTQSVRGVYDESKRLLESIAYSAARERGIRCLVLRIFNTYGPGMPDDGRVINTFVRQARAGERLTVHGSGSQSRSFGYVDDTISQITRLVAWAEDTLSPGDCEVFNVGCDQERSVMEAALIVDARMGTGIENIESPRPDDPAWRCPVLDRTRSAIGPITLTSLEEGIALCLL